ncbi:MAG: NAD(P)H-dependent oxidoreductase, partial [Candidatus ainarchaeum sp.]|nr:NAD(P)H-dependent oxidoreductase [Candidatus ainarchaeum sp.]
IPSILKGFFDRVFTPGFSHKFISKLNFNQLLKNKKASVICTTGAPKIAYSLGFANRGIKNIKKDILGFCGIKSKIYVIGNCTNQIDEKKKKEINKIILKAINF